MNDALATERNHTKKWRISFANFRLRKPLTLHFGAENPIKSHIPVTEQWFFITVFVVLTG